MKPSHVDIEKIVALVIERLESLRPEAGDIPTLNPSTHAKLLQLEDSVVSLDLLVNRSEKFEILQIPAKAVVTPSVRDWLRDRKIELKRTDQSQPDMSNIPGENISTELAELQKRKSVLICDPVASRMSQNLMTSLPVVRRNTAKQIVVESFSRLTKGFRVFVIAHDFEQVGEPLEQCPKTIVQRLNVGQKIQPATNVVLVPIELVSQISEVAK